MATPVPAAGGTDVVPRGGGRGGSVGGWWGRAGWLPREEEEGDEDLNGGWVGA